MSVQLVLVVSDLPADALADTLSIVLEEAIEQHVPTFEGSGDVPAMIELTHRAAGGDDSVIWNVRVLLPDDLEPAGDILTDFIAALPDGDEIRHVCRFEDASLREELSRIADELFELEMKLRRVLSIIYLRSPQGDQPYNLLRRDKVVPVTKDLKEAAMEAAAENQLFHMNFGNYGDLDTPPPLKIERVLATLNDAGSFEEWRADLTRAPIEVEDDKQLIAGLKERMNVLEQVRNCIAHHRRPTVSMRQNYPKARSDLHALLDQYLSQLAVA